MYKRQIYQIAESNRIETFLPELEWSSDRWRQQYSVVNIIVTDATVTCRVLWLQQNLSITLWRHNFVIFSIYIDFLLSLYVFSVASFYFLYMFYCLFYLFYHCYAAAFKSWFPCTFVTCCSINTQYSIFLLTDVYVIRYSSYVTYEIDVIK